jgi:hypothetical protein
VLQRNRLPTYTATGKPCPVPSEIMKATVYRKGDRLICSGSGSIMSNPKVRYDTFDEFVRSKPDLEWCTRNLKIASDCSELVDGIKAGFKGTIMAISDGSFKDTYGTAAWTIGVTDGDQYISGQVICPGDGTDHSSYRSELTGIYVILAITNQLCEYYDIQEGAIEIGCDGLSALQTSFDYGPHLSYDIPNYDLIGAIYHMRKMSKVSWTYRHVKGHQDKFSSDLDEWATQNGHFGKATSVLS